MLCIVNEYTGGLPWISTMVSSAWVAYGTSVSFYYNKGKAEQVAKIDKIGIEAPAVGIDTGDKPTI